MQKTHTSYGISLSGFAEASKFTHVEVIETLEQVTRFRARLQSTESGLRFAQIKIKVENLEKVLPPRDGVYVKTRFRAALGFTTK